MLRRTKIRQKGVGLVEIMVALLISSLLVAGVAQIFASNRQAYDLLGELSRLQENGRFAFRFMSQDLRMAGYMGCSRNLTVRNNLNNAAQYANNLDGAPLVGLYVDDEGTLRGSGAAAGPNLGGAKLVPNTGAIIVRRAGDGAVPLRPPYRENASPASTLVEQGHDLAAGDIVVVSDCTNATIVQLTSSSATGQNSAVTHNTGNSVSPGNANHDLGAVYGEGATISRVETILYYIAEGADGVPALFRMTGAGPAEELLGGVEDFQLSYGLDSNGDGALNGGYMSAAEIDNSATADWASVVAVRLDMLMRGNRNTVVDTGTGQSLVFSGAVKNYSDGFMRHAVGSTITMRNRVP